MSVDKTLSISSPELPLEPVQLIAFDGPGRGASLTLTEGTVIAGSGGAADLVIDDRTVSKEHASFELLHGAVRVTDLGSRNGLSYLGARVSVALLPIGTRITLGRTVIQIAAIASAPQSEPQELAGLIAHSPAMRQLLWRVERVAATNATAVIRGPTGSGKELVARAIHRLSARASGPIAFLDCASSSAELLESELFGHVRGAFTGATSDRLGLLESVAGGTLVLDNVDGLAPALQTRLLRFLEERTVRRVGASVSKTLDVRVLATSQSQLEEVVAAGTLRADLFYRLAQVVLEVPPLSRRVEDVPVLATCFVDELSTVPFTLSKATIAALQAHPWPGNVRELKNAIVRGLAFGRFEDTPQQVDPNPAPGDLRAARQHVVESFEADFLRALLAKHRWNVAAAARDAKIARSHFYTLIGRYQLNRDR